MKIDRSKDDITYKKWLPIVERRFQFRNTIINELICLYCEWYSNNIYNGTDNITDHSSDLLANELLEIRRKILSIDRVGIVGQFFNPGSGLIEYMLENGDFIPVSGNIEYEIPTKQKLEIFGIDFIRDLDPQKFRTEQLYKLL